MFDHIASIANGGHILKFSFIDGEKWAQQIKYRVLLKKNIQPIHMGNCIGFFPGWGIRLG